MPLSREKNSRLSYTLEENVVFSRGVGILNRNNKKKFPISQTTIIMFLLNQTNHNNVFALGYTPIYHASERPSVVAYPELRIRRNLKRHFCYKRNVLLSE